MLSSQHQQQRCLSCVWHRIVDSKSSIYIYQVNWWLRHILHAWREADFLALFLCCSPLLENLGCLAAGCFCWATALTRAVAPHQNSNSIGISLTLYAAEALPRRELKRKSSRCASSGSAAVVTLVATQTCNTCARACRAFGVPQPHKSAHRPICLRHH